LLLEWCGRLRLRLDIGGSKGKEGSAQLVKGKVNQAVTSIRSECQERIQQLVQAVLARTKEKMKETIQAPIRSLIARFNNDSEWELEGVSGSEVEGYTCHALPPNFSLTPCFAGSSSHPDGTPGVPAALRRSEPIAADCAPPTYECASTCRPMRRECWGSRFARTVLFQDVGTVAADEGL
jgi:hypothetical protein